MKKVEVRCCLNLYEKDGLTFKTLNKERKNWINDFDIKQLDQLIEKFINMNNHDYGEYWKKQIVHWDISIQVHEYDEFNRQISIDDVKIPYAFWCCDYTTKDWDIRFKDSFSNIEKYYNFIQDLIKE